MAYQYGCRPNRDPHKVGRRGCAVTSILRSKILAQGQFTCPEQDETGSPQNQGFCGAGDIIEAFQMEQIEV